MELSNKHANKRTKEAFDAAVAMIGCEPAALQAVISVEARDQGYDRHGRLIALFEPHRFYALLQKHAPSKLSDAVARGLAYRYQGERPYPKDSYPRIVEAMRIEEDLALQATSWGLPQILGENFKDAGYKSAADMVTDFLVGEDEQLTAMARLIVAWGLDEKLRQKDWQGFKNRYNGPKKNDYAARLARDYSRAKLKGVAIQATKAAASVVVASGSAAAVTNEAGGDWIAVLFIAGAFFTIGAVIFILARLNKNDDEPSKEQSISSAKHAPSAPMTGLQSALDHMRACKTELDKAVAVVAEERKKMRERLDAMLAAIEAAEAEATEVIKESSEASSPVAIVTSPDAQPS